MVEVVRNTASYLQYIGKIWQTGSASTDRLEDYPNCGIRNNDTFSYGSTPLSGGLATADWSAECLWDCNWQESHYVGSTRTYTDSQNKSLQLSITLTMPKVPVDLRCLDSCTDINFPVYSTLILMGMLWIAGILRWALFWVAMSFTA